MDTLGTKIDQVRETFGNQIENQNRTLLKQANTSDTKFDKLKKELEKVTQTLLKQANTYDTKFDKLQKELENVRKGLSKKLENVTQTLREQLLKQANTHDTKFDNLQKELSKKLENVNQTLQLSDFNWLFSSVILNANPNYITQMKTWFPLKLWQRCYRATTDGWASTTFHSKCDNKGPTVTIVRVGSYIFGGYTDLSWDSSSSYKTTSNSFIFSLKNKDNLAPFKAPVYRNSQQAIYCYSNDGPLFGGGHDFHIHNNANSNTYSHANLGGTYQPPSGYSYGSSNTQALLAGSYKFTPSEVEVFYLR